MQIKRWVKSWVILLNGMAIGNLCTSAVFYASYDIWKPLVWSAGINATLFVCIAFVRATSEL